jgi:hypothetical protein
MKQQIFKCDLCDRENMSPCGEFPSGWVSFEVSYWENNLKSPKTLCNRCILKILELKKIEFQQEFYDGILFQNPEINIKHYMEKNSERKNHNQDV